MISDQVLLALPPGRRNVLPHLAFTYSSVSGSGKLGVGWSLNAGKIERSTKKGVPQFTDADLFAYTLGGSSGELVSVAPGSYRAKFESQYRQFTRVGDGWEVREAQGTVYRFGTADASREGDAPSGHVATWMLDSVQDLNGNTVSFSYTRDGGTLYLSDVRYTGHAPTGDPGANEIQLEYEARPDPRVSYASGIRLEQNQRLHRISVFASGALVRRYVVGYDNASSASQASLLTSLVLVGSDDASQITARGYHYRNRTLGWSTTSIGGLPASSTGSDGHDLGIRYADLNGDGYADVVHDDGTVDLGDGAGHFATDAGWTASLKAVNAPFVDDKGIDQGVRLLDVNGDLRPDVLVATALGKRREVWLNTGAGFARDSAYSDSLGLVQETAHAALGYLGGSCVPADAGADASGPSCDQVVDYPFPFGLVQSQGDSGGALLADANGDGLVDILWNYRTSPSLYNFVPPSDAGADATGDAGGHIGRAPADIRAVYLNTGSGFLRSATLSSALTMDPFVDDTHVGGWDALDVNGDGVADLVRSSTEFARVVLLGNGFGWTQDAAYSASLAASDIASIDAKGKSLGLLPLDFNGDGLLDYIRSNDGETIAYRNAGSAVGWVADPGMTANVTALGLKLATGDGVPTGANVADVNGDAIGDLLVAVDGTPSTIRLGLGPVGDILDHAVSALGEVTDVAYAPSTSFKNVSPSGLQTLPTVLTLPISLTRSDGRGHAFASTFDYAGGLFQDRGFRGFATASITDPRGVVQRLHFLQDEALLGQVSSGETYDVGGATLRARKTSTYDVATPVAGVTQARLVQFDEETFDPASGSHPAGSVHTRTRTTYDDFMNVIEVDKDGDVTVTGDEARTVFTHVSNPALALFDPIARITTYDAAGQIASQTITLYDGLPEGQATAGNPTTVIDAVQIGGPTTQRTMEYDAYGNVLRGSDHMGNFSQFAYDAATHTYRTSVIDPNGRTVLSDFDARFGIPMQEQDENGHTTTRTVDAFGRVTQERYPGDESSPFGTRTFVYSALGSPTTQSVKVQATAKAGTSDILETITFFDGFGQGYATDAPGGGGQRVRVETEYDDAGNAASATRPHFAGAPAQTTLYARDALRRLTSITEPDGKSQTFAHYGTTTDVIDRRGDLARFVRDAYGSILEQHQFVGGADQTTRYQYDSLGNVTQITDALGEVTTITYDALSRRTKMVDPSMGTFQYAYDANGNLSQLTDPDGKVTRMFYDAARQLVRKELADGQVMRFEYDASKSTNTIGRLARVFDTAGTLEITYDARGNVATRKRTIDGTSYYTGYAYDSLKRVRRVVYPDGFVVDYDYDGSGYASRVTDGTGAVIADGITHAADGAIASIHYGNGVSSQRTYDAFERLDALTTTSPTGAKLQDRKHAYDEVGNVVAITDQAFGQSQSFAYDEKNRLVHATGAYGDEAYQYDAIGSLVRKGSIVMGYDATRKQQVTCGIDFAAAKDALGRGVHGPPSSLDARFADCMSMLAPSVGGSDAATLAQLEKLAHPGAMASERIFVASYDNRGNMVSKNDEDFTYDAEGRLTSVKRHGLTLEENVYDAGGWRVIRRSQPSTHSARGLALFIDGIFEVNDFRSLRHVRVGDMLLASVEKGGAPTLIDGSGLASLLDKAGGIGGGGSGCACGVTPKQGTGAAAALAFALGIVAAATRRGRRWFVAGGRVARASARHAARHPGRSLLTVLLIPAYLAQATMAQAAPGGGHANGPSDQRYYYHLDHAGNVDVISDQSGNLADHIVYTPFGEQIGRAPTPPGSDALNVDGPRSPDLEIALDGHRLDPATGLDYFGSRHYDPVLGRFIQADTRVVDPANPATLHRYAFNADNPVRYADPTGHGFWDVFLGVVVAVLAVAAIVIVSIGTAGVGDVLFAVAVGALIGIGAGAAVGAIIAYAKYGSLTSPEAIRLILGTAFVGLLAGATAGYIVGVGGLSAAFSSDSLATWATHDLVTNVLIGATAGAGGSEVAAGNDENFARSLFLGSLIGAGIGAVAGVSDGLAQIWEPIPWRPEVIAGLVSLVGGADAAFVTVNNYMCNNTGARCVNDYLAPTTSALETGSSRAALTAEALDGVPPWSFGGTLPSKAHVTVLSPAAFTAYPAAP